MKLRITLWAAALVTGAAAVLLPAAAASAPSAAEALVHGPRVHYGLSNSLSTNWSGYATTPISTGQFTAVSGNWTQPAVTCPSKQAQYSSFWVGIDGDNSNTVEQIGTDSDCQGMNRPVYYAWYEFYPAGSYTISSVPIHPGDSISASVTAIGSSFTVTLTNNSTGKTATVTQTVKNAAESSAEWIAEAPSIGSRITSLANYGTVNFTGSSTTMGSTTGTITNSAWNNDEISMVNNSGQVISQPTSTSNGGADFSISYVAPTTSGGGGHHHGHN